MDNFCTFPVLPQGQRNRLINNNKFIYSPISHRVQWTVQKLKHNISTYVRNITIKENHKNSTINEHGEEDKVSQETHEYAKDHSHQIQQLINIKDNIKDKILCKMPEKNVIQ